MSQLRKLKKKDIQYIFFINVINYVIQKKNVKYI